MKKQLIVALGLAVLATPALASRARLLALGENSNGSFYINDNRNIFLNAAEINNNKDLATFEWGGSNGQGGVTKSFNNLVFGLHLNNGSNFNTTEGLSATAPATLTGLTPNSIDLFVGGDAGVKWGANLTYVNGKDDAATVGSTDPAATATTDDITADAESKAMDLNVGVEAGDIKGFVNYGVNGEATYKDITALGVTKATVDRDQDLTVGGSYRLNAYTFFGQYTMDESTAKVDGTKTTTKNDGFEVGAGRQDKLNDKVTLFTKASYSNSNSEEKTGSTKSEDKGWNVPVVIGLETEATSWLAVRGSVSQSILSSNEEKETSQPTVKSTNNDSTLVNVGASLRFGEFSVDGVLSNNASGKITLDDAMSTVSMTYKF